MMDQEVKTRWLEALKSGKYLKGFNNLCRGNQYCCLGVFAEIENLFTGEQDGVKYIETCGEVSYSHTHTLPGSILDKYKISHDTVLMHLNDSNETFDEVIEYIEKNL